MDINQDFTPTNRLRLVDSLLHAAGDSVSALQRLLAEVSTETEQVRREVERAPRDAEVHALRREVEQLRDGLTSRAVIERSKGILMRAYALTESQAFDLLAEMSQSRHRKLREVAADLVDGVLELPPQQGDPPDGAGSGKQRAGHPPARSGPAERQGP